MNEEYHIALPGRTLKEIEVEGGTIVVQNCSPMKVFLRVEWKRNENKTRSKNA